jgi:hypothetical protein
MMGLPDWSRQAKPRRAFATDFGDRLDEAGLVSWDALHRVAQLVDEERPLARAAIHARTPPAEVQRRGSATSSRTNTLFNSSATQPPASTKTSRASALWS